MHSDNQNLTPIFSVDRNQRAMQKGGFGSQWLLLNYVRQSKSYFSIFSPISNDTFEGMFYFHSHKSMTVVHSTGWKRPTPESIVVARTKLPQPTWKLGTPPPTKSWAEGRRQCLEVFSSQMKRSVFEAWKHCLVWRGNGLQAWATAPLFHLQWRLLMNEESGREEVEEWERSPKLSNSFSPSLREL